MGYPTESTDWPSTQVLQPVKSLIDLFFRMADDTTSKAGETMASSVFTTDAVMVNGAKRFEGSENIRKSRDHAWNGIKSRRHKVIKVYTSTVAGDDLLLIGKVDIVFENGIELPAEFTARVVVNGISSSSPRIKLYQVWADSAPVKKALEG